MKNLILLFLLIQTTAYCSEPVQEDRQIKILFIGNSLTYSYNLPKLVQDIGEQNGVKLKTEMIAKPNYALEDHWLEGIVQERIENGAFDFVIVQQGPSSQEDGRLMLLDFGQKLADKCTAAGAKLAFFMVWPSRQYYHTFDGVIKNYSEAALETNSILCPVGQVWKEYFDTTNDFSYYGPDGFHPSELGTTEAARIIFESIAAHITK